MPTVVVAGEEDTVNSPQTARDLADTVPHAELVVLPEAGHLTPMEAPEAVVDAVSRVLG